MHEDLVVTDPESGPEVPPGHEPEPRAAGATGGWRPRLRRVIGERRRLLLAAVGVLAVVGVVAARPCDEPPEADAGANTDHEGHEVLRPDQIALTDRAKILAAVRTTPVRRVPATGASLRLQGSIEYDETTLQTITAWIGGRVDRLHLNVTGERVRRGQVVATLYSPEVYAAQQDLVAARRQVQRLGSASELVRSSAESMLEAARERLRLLGIPRRDLERMESASSPQRQVPIRSPFSGTVIERIVTEGAYVQAGSPLYRVADLTRLWVQLDAYESDLPHLALGQSVELEVEALPGEVFEGRVAFVDPVIHPRRRTARVRIAVSNPERELRPGMFVQATVRASGGDAEGSAQPLVVPATAPLFTGRRSVVYVETATEPRPTYEARVVRLGPRIGDLYPVVAGLAEGERVVTRGAFALDADLQIRGGDSMMTQGDDTEPGLYDEVIEVPTSWRAPLTAVVDAYLRFQARLADDDAEGAVAAARALVSAVVTFSPTEPTLAADAWGQLAAHLRMHGQRATEATTLEELRAQLEGLSARMVAALQVFGNPTREPLYVAYCPMAFDNRGAVWIQDVEPVANAYFGAAMRTCGEVHAAVAPGGYLGAARSPEPAPSPRRQPAGGHQH